MRTEIDILRAELDRVMDKLDAAEDCIDAIEEQMELGINTYRIGCIDKILKRYRKESKSERYLVQR